MMRLWSDSYAKRTPVVSGATISVVVHVGIIAAWVAGTRPAPNVPEGSLANRVYFIPPPDKSPGRAPVQETVRYVERALEGPGSGDGPRMMGEARPVTADETVGRAPTQDSVTHPPVAPATGTQDSVYAVIDVDTAVARSANSAAPAYPLSLLSAHVMGFVNARYIVDTTGFADTASFVVLKATNTEFVTAVRDALPYMRFQPAKIGPMKVKQLVEQQFSFKITDTVVARRKP
jgi:hypothetical protein